MPSTVTESLIFRDMFGAAGAIAEAAGSMPVRQMVGHMLSQLSGQVVASRPGAR